MSIVRTPSNTGEPREALALPAPEDTADQLPAWEEIESGRYRPRRIRGSFRGRELG
jgi:hypothetical protein